MARALHDAHHLDGIVIDVGANGGAQTSTALIYGRKVLAFECLSDAYNAMLKQIGANPSVRLIKACVGSKVGLAQLHLAQDSSSMFANAITHGDEKRKAREQHTAQGRTIEDTVVVPLDLLLREDEPVAVVKIDVQGAERNVFEGMKRLLLRWRPGLMFEEDLTLFGRGADLNGTLSLEAQFLTPLGYKCTTHQQVIGRDKVCHVPGPHDAKGGK